MATKAEQIFPFRIRYYTDTRLPDGTVKSDETNGETPETTRFGYLYGGKEDDQGQKVDPFPFNEAIIETMMIGGKDWNHEYPPLGFAQAPEVTQSFLKADKPYVRFFYRTKP